MSPSVTSHSLHKSFVRLHKSLIQLMPVMLIAKIRPKSCKTLHDHTFSRFKKRFGDISLNDKAIILLNLAEYRLILANSAYGLDG